MDFTNLLLFIVPAFALSELPLPAERLEFEAEGEGFFRYHSPSARKAYLGARLDDKHASRDHRIVTAPSSDDPLPKGFVAGWHKWAACQGTISYIKDQAACGSCWAVAASQVIAHRTCIACDGEKCKTHSKFNQLLNENRPCIDMSAEQILACCSWCGDGCEGGYPIDAMQYWAKTGVVSGGWYGSKCGCQPYQIPPYGASSEPMGMKTPACKSQCESGYPVPLAQDKHYASDARKVVGEAAMMEEIFNHGSIECVFSVYSNFMKYKSGIYDHSSGFYEGGHAITIIGWGETTAGTKYWVINNSWNSTWGQSGRFFWARGNNLLGMEAGCVAGTPKCNNHNDLLTCL